MKMATGRRAVVVAALAACPAYFVFAILWPRSFSEQNTLTYDFYAYFYPNILHALRSFEAGFGLFWNPYQNCGQPFFAFSLTALLHPPNLVFFLLDREAALLASMLLNLTIGGIGAWLLFRELRLSVVAALVGALAFEVSASALDLTAWGPMHIGPYVWLPWALFGVERVLRKPTVRRGIALAAILALQLLPGYPLPSLFTVQLIALRVVLALVRREVERPTRLIVPLAIGLGAAPLLVAVQYIPSLQVALASVRASGLDDSEVLGAGRWGYQPGLAALMLAAASLFGPRHRTLAWFYFGVGSVFAVLTLGDRTPLFDLYTARPLGDLFIREPWHFFWVTSFALSVLVAIGVDEIARDPGPDGRVRRAALLVAMLVAALLVYANPAQGAARWEWAAAGVAFALAVWGAGRLPGHVATPWVLALVVGASGLYAARAPALDLYAGSLYGRYQQVFAVLRDRMTPQDRVLLNVTSRDIPLVRKTASIFRVPAVGDYEPQTTRRFAEYTVRRNTGRPMRSLNDFLYGPLLNRGYSRPLVNLAATRYLVVPDRARRKGLGGQWREVFHSDEATIYENRRAKARAAFVPGVRVVPRERVLETLDDRRHRPGRVALVEEAPASGFLGSPGGVGRVEFVEDRGERVVLRVHAPKAGFLHLADQYFPGWTVHVNGEPAEILRANYVFRIVEVPAGESTVVFEYGLTPIYIGAAISLLTLAALSWLWRREARASIASGAVQET